LQHNKANQADTFAFSWLHSST